MSAHPHRDVLESSIRESAMVWMELRGMILDQNRQERSKLTDPPLRANWMQKEEERVIQWMEAKGMPSRVIKLKGRRQGSSTGTLAQMAHRVRARPTSALIVGLEYEKNVKAMEETFWRFVETDRFDWGVQFTRHKGSGGEFTNNSKLSLQSANTPNAGRGDGAQFALFTEAAYYPNTEQRSEADLFKNLFQLIPRTPGTVIVIESTPNGEGGKFHETWMHAISFAELQAAVASGLLPPDWNGFVKIFYPWHEFPDYVDPCTEAEAAEIMRTLSEREEELMEEHPATMTCGRLKWRRRVISGPDFEGDEEGFESEYPSDERRCFASTGRKRFLWQSISTMKKEAHPGQCGILRWLGSGERHASFEVADERESWIRIFHKPWHGFSHIISVDPMKGDQAGGTDPDNHGVGVLRAGGFDGGRWYPPALAARIADCHGEQQSRKKLSVVCRWGVDVLSERIARAAKYYGNCPIVVEENMDTGIIQDLRDRGTMNIYRRETVDKITQIATEYYGWRTTPKNRSAIIEQLAVAIRTLGMEGGGIDIADVRVITELERMIVKENGREEAGPGWHDDTVLMLAFGLACIGKATPYIDRLAMRQLYDDDEDDRGRRRDATWS